MLLRLCEVRVSGRVALERSVRMRNTRSSRPPRLPYQISEISRCGSSVSWSRSSQDGIQKLASAAYNASQASQSLSSR